ncbi:MAG: alpha-glucan family phosphorylase [Gloeomargaritaceae cyanobacterium C42_A2020_066]|nr:alpha-glucan family phosphorylase [Gloeomargaritaceae cyanobacterium C42_A2020_066]
MTQHQPSPLVDRLRSRLPHSLAPLAELALNFWWSWSPDRLSIFRQIDSELWDAGRQNPVYLLENVSYERLTQLAIDPDYLARVHRLQAQLGSYLQASQTWASHQIPHLTAQQPVAYFCAEFGLHQSLPIYSGGLGILAGDHLKTASDLGIPMVGIGLLYRQGYFRQRLNRAGWQEDYYVDNRFDELPLERLYQADGRPLCITVEIRERTVTAQVWRVQVGRVSLYLMDTDLPDNDSIDRWLTGHLYGGNQETRVAQEILLGIGGVRVLNTLGITPSTYHLNEGHAAFCLLELARQRMASTGKSFYAVEPWVQEHCIFTTHTPVPAGHDAFTPDLMDSYFAQYWPHLNLTREQFLSLGARRLGDPWEPFNMTVLALRLCRAANGVSALHGEVSRQMWHILYPERQESEVPIGHITNGVHVKTWTAPLLEDLYSQYLGADWDQHLTDAQMWAKVDTIPDGELWWRHQVLKERLIAHTRVRMKQARLSRGESPEHIHRVDHLLDPDVLTIGFARRFSAYKRAFLLIKDPERAFRIFTHAERPVQIVFAGKAHPADEEGKRIIQRLMEWCNHPALHARVAFIEDYDIHTARRLVQGVDLWLNNPRRPLEASGTSGQKVCFNGGINLSVLDGWWCEGYQAGPDGKGLNGWAIGEDLHTSQQEAQDRLDSESLYQLLENEIVPLYYSRNEQGLPVGWIAKMKASIRTCAPLFNTERMLQDYALRYYAGQASPVLAGRP